MFDTIKPETDPVATILAGVAVLAGEDRDGWQGAALSERLVAMLEVRERLDAEITRLAGRWDREQAWAVEGALSGAGWLTRKAPIGKTKARRLVAAGRMTVDHPAVEDALASGDVTVDHRTALTPHLKGGPPGRPIRQLQARRGDLRRRFGERPAPFRGSPADLAPHQGRRLPEHARSVNSTSPGP